MGWHKKWRIPWFAVDYMAVGSVGPKPFSFANSMKQGNNQGNFEVHACSSHLKPASLTGFQLFCASKSLFGTGNELEAIKEHNRE